MLKRIMYMTVFLVRLGCKRTVNMFMQVEVDHAGDDDYRG